jgi:hypothetical protein
MRNYRVRKDVPSLFFMIVDANSEEIGPMGKLDQLYSLTEIRALKDEDIKALEALIYHLVRSDDVLEIIRGNNETKEACRNFMKSRVDSLYNRLKSGT